MELEAQGKRKSWQILPPVHDSRCTNRVCTWLEIAPDGSVTNYGYDDLGRNRMVGQVVRHDANAVYATTTDYDDLGNVILSINPASKSKAAAFNAAGQVVTATDEIGVSTQYGYTPNTGWLSSVIRANDRRAATTFDTGGRKTAVSVTDSTGATVFATDQWTYDANSNPLTHTRPNGATESYGQNLWMTFLVLLRGVPFF